MSNTPYNGLDKSHWNLEFYIKLKITEIIITETKNTFNNQDQGEENYILLLASFPMVNL